MFGGVGKSAGWATILGAVGVVLGGSVSAKAADLGGDCCADLEERVAELEATTARKGNRKVSLTISGWVNEAVFWWDDGTQRGVYQGTNDLEQTRFRFTGEAKIHDGWSAGFLLEVGADGSPSNKFSQTNDTVTSALTIRKSYWFLKSKDYGQVAVGQNGTATYHLLDDADGTNTRNFSDYQAAGVLMESWKLRSNGNFVGAGLRWNDIMHGPDNNTAAQSKRLNVVRYDSPTFAGFTASWAWGANDLWDAKLNYKGNIGDFALLGQVGYARNGDETVGNCSGTDASFNDCTWFGVAGTIMHTPTGLYVYGGYGKDWDPARRLNFVPKAQPNAVTDDTSWFIQTGIEHKWLPLGKTTVFGEFRHDDWGSNPTKSTDGPLSAADFVKMSNLDFWAGGAVQHIDAAAMDLYVIYRRGDGTLTAGNNSEISLDAFQAVIGGALIQF